MKRVEGRNIEFDMYKTGEERSWMHNVKTNDSIRKYSSVLPTDQRSNINNGTKLKNRNTLINRSFERNILSSPRNKAKVFP